MKFRKDHVLPTVRIQKIELENFKSVHHGEIVFNCGRKVVEQDTEADILGIYGQNGSGKTSVIEAIAILKSAIEGEAVNPRYAECVAANAEYAKLTFVFDFQYPVEKSPYTRTVTYSFKMEAVPREKSEEDQSIEHFRRLSELYPKKVRIFDEVISASGLFNGEVQKKQDILTTFAGKYPIGPVRKIQEYVGEDKDAVEVDLKAYKIAAERESKSFIFYEGTMELFEKHSGLSEYFYVLSEMHYYGMFYLYAVDTRISGINGSRLVFPFNTRMGLLPLNLMMSSQIPEHIFEELKSNVNSINTVLPALVADMELVLESNDFSSGERSGKEVRLLSKRQDVVIPLRDESAGIIKLVSILSLVISAYTDRSVTVAIDELDAGIYEYLLGEILSGLETYGKGQLVFTSHNLRPLEVLKKESIIFTTSNPDNRYIRLKGVGRTNNLRSLYFREILGNSQDEKLYDAAKRQRMIAAFMKAGVDNAKEE